MTHGFEAVGWDDFRLPPWFWKNVTQDGGCWMWTGKRELYPEHTVVRRLMKVPWSRVLAAVPTCGRSLCVNPAHLCVTLKEEDDGDDDRR